MRGAYISNQGRVVRKKPEEVKQIQGAGVLFSADVKPSVEEYTTAKEQLDRVIDNALIAKLKKIRLPAKLKKETSTK